MWAPRSRFYLESRSKRVRQTTVEHQDILLRGYEPDATKSMNTSLVLSVIAMYITAFGVSVAYDGICMQVRPTFLRPSAFQPLVANNTVPEQRTNILTNQPTLSILLTARGFHSSKMPSPVVLLLLATLTLAAAAPTTTIISYYTSTAISTVKVPYDTTFVITELIPLTTTLTSLIASPTSTTCSANSAIASLFAAQGSGTAVAYCSGFVKPRTATHTTGIAEMVTAPEVSVTEMFFLYEVFTTPTTVWVVTTVATTTPTT